MFSDEIPRNTSVFSLVFFYNLNVASWVECITSRPLHHQRCNSITKTAAPSVCQLLHILCQSLYDRGALMSSLQLSGTACSCTYLVLHFCRGVLEENIWGSKTKKLTFFNRCPQNTGQNYQINHSNPPKNAPRITVSWLHYCILLL